MFPAHHATPRITRTDTVERLPWSNKRIFSLTRADPSSITRQAEYPSPPAVANEEIAHLFRL
jgi:hypothetical protein